MTTRFNGPIGAVPIVYTPKAKTVEQIAAVGRALPKGAHTLTGAQQTAWFGAILFDAPVSWDGEAFVSGDKRLTPSQIVRGAH